MCGVYFQKKIFKKNSYNFFIHTKQSMNVLVNAQSHSSDDLLWFRQVYVFLSMINKIVNDEDAGRRINDFIFV